MGAAIYRATEWNSKISSGGWQQLPPLVLVVDDEESVRELVSEVLEEEGYLVMTAENGRDALAVAIQTRPRLIVTDLMMPAMNGRLLCERLRSEPKTAHIPVVLMSAAYRPQPGDPFAATISKPFGIDELVEVVERTLPQKVAPTHTWPKPSRSAE